MLTATPVPDIGKVTAKPAVLVNVKDNAGILKKLKVGVVPNPIVPV